MVDSPGFNVLVMGETGSGKSSVVNLLVGTKVAEVSNEASACTTKTIGHTATIQGKTTPMKMHIWEVVGFNQPEDRYGKALDMDLDPIFQANARVDVILFCMQGSRLRNTPTRIFEHLNNVLGGRIVVPVITNLEREEDMESWWGKYGDRVGTCMGLSGTEHACITGLQDRKYEAKSMQSRALLISILEGRYSLHQNSIPAESILGEHVPQNGRPNEKQRKDASRWKWW
ncbi:hypothetical protein EDC04DRAFT_454647 [Pisolithus marmoratus]|nr:hypothetical protein EDC04DRAFT_454647 [Pisolithus marmoratus]